MFLAVRLVVSSVPIDLSQHAQPLLERCLPHLSSQNPDTRRDTLDLVCALARQCSDASAVLQVLPLLTATLKGEVTVGLQAMFLGMWAQCLRPCSMWARHAACGPSA